jgi:N-acetylneuraminic acid mutarotase
VATGASNKEIAQRLTISTNTVKVHLRNIFAKIDAASRTEAAMYAVKTGLVESAPRVQGEYSDEDAALPLTQSRPGTRTNPWTIVFLVFLLILLFGTASLLIWNNLRQPQVEVTQSDIPEWQENSPLPTARYGLAACVYDNLIYTIAGRTKNGETSVVEAYDPEQNSWEGLRNKPTAVSDVSAVVIGGKIYVPGGRLQSGKFTSGLEIYNPRTDTWSAGASLPEAVSSYALAVSEGKLYLFGGWNGEQYLDIVLEYDPDQDTWAYKTPLSLARAYSAATEVNEKIYLMGGFDGKAPLDLNEIYSPDLDDGSGNPWSVSAHLPSGRFGMGVTNILDNLYLIGGEGNETSKLPAYWFSTQSGEWQVLNTPLMGGIQNFGFSAIEANIYITGGRIENTPVNSNLSYKILYITLLPIVP